MKKFVLTSCILGFTLLVVGVVFGFPSLQRNFSYIIPSTGRIVYPEESPSQQTVYQTQLNQIGYLTILGSISFFIIALVYNLKSKG